MEPNKPSKPKNTAIDDPTRTFMKAYRTCCDCRACTILCEWLPGYLIPDDLQLLDDYFRERAEAVDVAAWTEDSLVEWAMEHLLASPGAAIIYNGVPMRVPTLVPARQEDGHTCIFLEESQLRSGGKACTIHSVAPFGCAFFDAHQDADYGLQLSSEGLMQVIKAWQETSLYAKIWTLLHRAGKVAPSPTESRRRLHEAWTLEEINRRAADEEQAKSQTDEEDLWDDSTDKPDWEGG